MSSACLTEGIVCKTKQCQRRYFNNEKFIWVRSQSVVVGQKVGFGLGEKLWIVSSYNKIKHGPLVFNCHEVRMRFKHVTVGSRYDYRPRTQDRNH